MALLEQAASEKSLPPLLPSDRVAAYQSSSESPIRAIRSELPVPDERPVKSDLGSWRLGLEHLEEHEKT